MNVCWLDLLHSLDTHTHTTNVEFKLAERRDDNDGGKIS